MANLKKLEQIKADILNKNICPDLAQGATQIVMGHGNPNARVVFIGEAPGKKEDALGIPFVGAAGKLLDEMLEANSVARSDVYITNIVKYRPPNNRDPQPDEKHAFWPFLLQELEVIRPDVVVTLGRHSMEYFLPDKQISEVHGMSMKIAIDIQLGTIEIVDAEMKVTPGNNYVSTTLLPLYHPAAAIYNRSLRQTLFDDFALIRNLI